MQIVLVILVSAFYGGFYGKDVLAVPIIVPSRVNSDYSFEQVFNSLAGDQRSEPINGVDVIGSKISKLQKNQIIELPTDAQFLIETVKQRDKRYISSLGLCHFKICKMGRKRAARYFQVVRGSDYNDP